MNPFNIAGQDALNEVLEFSRKLGRGIDAVTRVGEVQVGCSDKDPVYSEDKLTLYRYRPLAESAGRAPILLCYALVSYYFAVVLVRRKLQV